MKKFNSQSGISIVSAIFIVAVLSIIAGFMFNMSGTQAMTTTMAIQSSRAYQAARSGIEWGAYDIFNNAGANCTSAPSTLSINTGAGNDFTVVVICVDDPAAPIIEDGTNINTKVITATATYANPGDLDYVRRQIESVVSESPP